MSIQLKGNLKLATVEYGAAISQFTIQTKREEIKTPATLATGVATSAAGAKSEFLQITFHSSLAAASVWAELYDAISTDSAEIAFEGSLNPGSVGADNPKFSGTIVILSLDTGGVVSKLREQTQTDPVTAAGITKAIV